MSYTGKTGTHGCRILVDGAVVLANKLSSGLCTYPIPAGTGQGNGTGSGGGTGQNLPYGPDTCKQGYVWRDARPGDHVCVTPQTRAETAQGERRRRSAARPNGDPNGGA